MKTFRTVSLLAALALLILLPSTSFAQSSDDDGDGNDFKDVLRADLNGFSEVPNISTPAKARFRARIEDRDTIIRFTLTYEDISTGTPTQAHLHFSSVHENGGVLVFLCGGGGKPACPAAPATVTGTITAADMVAGAAAQGIAAGDFAEFLKAIRSDETYANVHSATFPAGEARGQVKASFR